MPEKLYILTRRDMSNGNQATQAAHAAFSYACKYPEETKKWHDESNYLIFLSVKDQEELLDYYDRALQLGLKQVIINEPDWEGQPYTALVIEPGLRTSELCANLPLALREDIGEILLV